MNKIFYTIRKNNASLDVYSKEMVNEVEDTTIYFKSRKDAVVAQKKYCVGGFITEHDFSDDIFAYETINETHEQFSK